MHLYQKPKKESDIGFQPFEYLRLVPYFGMLSGKKSYCCKATKYVPVSTFGCHAGDIELRLV